MNRLFCTATLTGLTLAHLWGFTGEANASDEKMAWWHEAKFGLFVHFGLYAVPANTSEWHMRVTKKSIAEYSKYADQFNPTNFNANEWAQIAQEAGMKYMVIVTKHHDGFALFQSAASQYNIVDATPFKRDIVQELAEACPRHDVKFGVYYSLIADWGHPGGGIGCPPWDPAQRGDRETYFNGVAFPQVRELLTKYGPISEIWFDTDGPDRPTAEQAARVASLIKEYQPTTIVNDRVIKGDFSVAEVHMPAQANPRNWEGCDVIISGSWGYLRSYRPQDVKPLSVLIRQLVDVVSKGGNFLLNVGPKPDGTFPQDSIDRLKGIGAWLKVNGESIYGATASPFAFLPWGRCTRKGEMLYLHIFDWPADGRIRIPMTNEIVSARLLGDGGKSALKAQQVGSELVVSLPAIPPDPIASVVVLQVRGEPQITRSLNFNKPTEASAIVDESKFAVDADPGTAWQIPEGGPSWLAVDMQADTTFNTLRIGLGRGRITEFSLDYWLNDHWETIIADQKLPLDESVRTFAPVTARKVRLNFKEAAKEVIRLNSFELFHAH